MAELIVIQTHFTGPSDMDAFQHKVKARSMESYALTILCCNWDVGQKGVELKGRKGLRLAMSRTVREFVEGFPMPDGPAIPIMDWVRSVISDKGSDSHCWNVDGTPAYLLEQVRGGAIALVERRDSLELYKIIEKETSI